MLKKGVSLQILIKVIKDIAGSWNISSTTYLLYHS